jgi:hypothetical protein
VANWVLGEFPTSEALLKAAERLRTHRPETIETYSPYPIQGSSEALGLKKSKVPVLALVGGLAGGSFGYLVQFLTNAVDWPINIGGRPPHSAPAFVPITFESGVLLSAFSIFFGLWAILRLPQPYHPAFDVDAFRSASSHGFWLSIETEQTGPQIEDLSRELRTLGALQVAVAPERS